jgi:hypothetical protein
MAKRQAAEGEAELEVHCCKSAAPTASLTCTARHPQFLHALHGLLQQLVESADLCCDARIDGSLTDFDDETAKNAGVNVGDNLELLALAILGLADGGFDTAESLLVQFLLNELVLSSHTLLVEPFWVL